MSNLRKSETFRKAKWEAFNTVELFPHVCIDILEKYYGKRMDRMRPSTIFDMVSEMMLTRTDADYNQEIIEDINEWLENY